MKTLLIVLLIVTVAVSSEMPCLESSDCIEEAACVDGACRRFEHPRLQVLRPQKPDDPPVCSPPCKPRTEICLVGNYCAQVIG
ncbi:unnamed protein product [Caenorhabditis sp. 36 PRJEB53466]|nr:unnamed protein product [Caenorhabditis sp. 36 PRJEB53466]